MNEDLLREHDPFRYNRLLVKTRNKGGRKWVL